MRVMRPLRVGLVSTMSRAFHGDQAGQYSQSVEAMQALADRWQFELCPVRSGVFTVADGHTAIAELRDWHPDFVLVQVSGFGPGEFIHALADLDFRTGIWAVPEGEPKVGGVPFLSLTGLTMYNK